MKQGAVAAKNVNEYLEAFPPGVRKTLQQLRQTIRAAAPGAEETISYSIPAYRYKGVLVYFGGYQNHIGFYPVSSAIANFKNELSKYKTSKGTVQFSHDEPLPLGLIGKMVKFRVKENEEKFAARKKKDQRHKKRAPIRSPMLSK